MKRKIVLLGSTGSIGVQTLEVVAKNLDKFEMLALSCAGNNLEIFLKQAVFYKVPVLGIAAGDQNDFLVLLRKYCVEKKVSDYFPQLFFGEEASAKLAGLSDADIVLNAITGSVGLLATLAALDAGHVLALANKESLIVGGSLVTDKAKRGQIVPVDSEHSALAQCLLSGSKSEVQNLILTASGGPFWGYSLQQLATVSPEQALSHPTWNMGKIITTNSATLVNKGLELIEASLLFEIPLEKIVVVVHRQSVVHSMVEFVDGSTIAQCSPPDMKLPISLALSWPKRIPNVGFACDWSQKVSWTFEPLDNKTFPAVDLARQVGKAALTYPAVYNAANEEAVFAFHSGIIDFVDIVDILKFVVDKHVAEADMCLENVLAAQAWARKTVHERF